MNPPFFSVVTVTRNNVLGLSRTIESLSEQDFSDWEHIIVDGASTDGSVEWLTELDDDQRRRWTSAPDQGIYDAMNIGMSRASGTLTVFLNAGDTLGSGSTLSLVMNDYTARRWLWCYGAVRYVDLNRDSVGAYLFDPYRRAKFLMGLNWVPHATVYMDARLMRRIGPFSLGYGTSADQEWLMRAAIEADPRVITEFLADFERGGVSQSVGPRERELAWHRMRGDHGQYWGGSQAVDRVASELLALRKPFRIALSRLTKRKG